MYTYQAFYKTKRIFVEADTSYAAQTKAAQELKVPKGKEHQVSVYLVQKDEEPVVHTADF